MVVFGGSSYPVLSIQEAGTPFEGSVKQTTAARIWDYIIVGGGTAGCCLASRLSEDPSVSVLLLERGSVHNTWYSRIPLISSDVTNKATPIIKSPSIPVKSAQGQRIDVVQAEVLGGASGVNAMLLTRGAVGDFNHWAELGHPSWDYDSLKPYFMKSEKSVAQHSDFRGSSVLPFEIQRNVREAAIALGYEHASDFNAPDVPVNVCATPDVTIDDQMRRVSSYHAFLPAALVRSRRKRLQICTKVVGTRIEFEGDVAVGVVFESSDKSVPGKFYARARKEVVVSCGAIGSPQLLLLSGIGPKEDVENHGIPSVVDLPGVGNHLQDHVGLPIMYEVPLQDTLHHSENSIWKGVLELAKYMFGIKGVMGYTVSPMSIFGHSAHIDTNTSAVVNPITPIGMGSDRPDIEIMNIPHYCSDPGQHEVRKGIFSFLLCLLQPQSMGSVRLVSSDPHVRPAVDLGFLTNPDDYFPLRAGTKLSLQLARNVAAQGYPIKGFQVPVSEEEDDLDEFIRTHLRTVYHYTSTCRMAKRDEDGVVDDDLKVYGVRGLRVCDASVFPCITSAHTMAPVLAVAERCADIMKLQAKLTS
ncbi:Alcohol oxidase [Mycena venus]|uniref:Alcohol oxidase n=1 Tax=Mycena venus TaxID=2733690 RepID=A0A8H6YXD6_9AGAR|nr:Alcohol oxidase [Mycena venus]